MWYDPISRAFFQTWDWDIAGFAQFWNGHLADECGKLEHSTGAQRNNITNWIGKYAGENLAAGSRGDWALADQLNMADSGELS